MLVVLEQELCMQQEKNTQLGGAKAFVSMLGICFMVMLTAFDQTVVGTALPRIVADLQGFSYYSWVGSGYLLTSAICLPLTGKLGDVMKESAQAALSYVRSISEGYGIDAEFYTKHDIHIHIPEGAVPKDGPSAGITMATAMLSAITDRAVRADVAMTGEITLRGRVLPIGGLKEKLLAAKVIGIKTVCIPKDNEKDLEEISKEITDGMEIVPVERFSQVEKIAFVK